ncbi:MAG: 50S ribosomal protein L2 [Candidatus Midichloria sp.]|nr:50S ribosomal protein L2 [Candidatus Midichloria sp.]
MALKNYNPITAATRQLILVDRSGLWKGKPERLLVKGMSSSGGRNNLGRITAWKKGGGVKVKYRVIDFLRKKIDIEATVERLEYDPNRTAFIALIKYTDGTLSYIIAPQDLKVGDKIISAESADIKVGNTIPLKNIPMGTVVHNVEMKPGKGGQIARSAGAFVQLVGKGADYALIRLRSGKTRKVLANCRATIGTVSNPDNQNIKFGKAGRKRWLGIRPTVRGVAMNPVDHPHGGGEGKTSGGRHPVTPWGKPTKGKKTRNNKRTNRYIINSGIKGN